MKYQVELYDFRNGATSPIDIVEVEEEYTPEQYIKDCERNCDEEYCEMLKNGIVTLIKVEE